MGLREDLKVVCRETDSDSANEFICARERLRDFINKNEPPEPKPKEPTILERYDSIIAAIRSIDWPCRLGAPIFAEQKAIVRGFIAEHCEKREPKPEGLMAQESLDEILGVLSSEAIFILRKPISVIKDHVATHRDCVPKMTVGEFERECRKEFIVPYCAGLQEDGAKRIAKRIGLVKDEKA